MSAGVYRLLFAGRVWLCGLRVCVYRGLIGWVQAGGGLALEKCFLPESDSRVGGGLWMVISSTFMGGSRANGAWPCASSRMVMPNDQMSASELYLHAHPVELGAYFE